MLKRILAYFFLLFIVLAFFQCGRRGSPTGGPKDETPPVLIKTEPENLSVDFKAKKIRLYFDEYIKLEKIQDQLIISPPLKYQPIITPQGSASKYIEIVLKDTLKENTTYTFNFGQSIVDNNEGNPNSFLTYVFSTGPYVDSLKVSGVVKDAFDKEADDFISVMLYELDSTYTDSTIYQRPPNYITNTLDSTIIFNLNYLKAGDYALFAVKDQAKNNVFDQKADKIGFINDTVSLPTDSTYLLSLFKEIPDYNISVPSLAAKNRVIFGYQGNREDINIQPLTKLPDTVNTIIKKEKEKDTLNYWFTPFENDSLVFTVTNERLQLIDTFTVKNRKLALDSLRISSSASGKLNFGEPFYIEANIPIMAIDTAMMKMMNKDSINVTFDAILDSINNKVDIEFTLDPNESYALTLLPGALTDFFETQNDTLNYRLSTGSYADYGNLRINLAGNVQYPLIVQLTTEKGETKREIVATEPKPFEFANITPGNYMVRLIFDKNGNGAWDTGNYLKRIQPEKVRYLPKILEVRANWELDETFTVPE
ncbi:Ig-like domain-containing protein [Costertonia aggregata]|uniref:Ig-like domain-containing protein n=1 Tax=Costertonia aggregata TaxID=343403 RepID=A0A7H9AQ68_9FLAO|nr:Ig-like domain-containing protein [Costertonia aggregata]QLG45576.1 Ig-like domain-containing protein [Costertonia aggregata]